MSPRIRAADSTDVQWLSGQLSAFSLFYGTKKQLFNPETCESKVQNIIDNHVCFIAEHHGKRLGFIAGYLIPHPYNEEITVLQEAFFWVDKSYRGSKAALLLLNRFTDFGQSNADWVVFTLEHHSPMSSRHLERRGFKLQEQSYLMEVS